MVIAGLKAPNKKIYFAKKNIFIDDGKWQANWFSKKSHKTFP